MPGLQFTCNLMSWLTNKFTVTVINKFTISYKD